MAGWDDFIDGAQLTKQKQSQRGQTWDDYAANNDVIGSALQSIGSMSSNVQPMSTWEKLKLAPNHLLESGAVGMHNLVDNAKYAMVDNGAADVRNPMTGEVGVSLVDRLIGSTRNDNVRINEALSNVAFGAGSEDVKRQANADVVSRNAELNAMAPHFNNKYGQMAYNGLQSTAQQLPAMAASVALKSPTPMMAYGAGSSGFDKYRVAREAGYDTTTATTAGAASGAIEALTEKLPAHMLFSDVAKGSGILKTVGKQMLTDVPGEVVAGLSDAAIDTQLGLNGSKKGNWDDYIGNIYDNVAQSVIGSIVGSGIQGGAIGGLNRLAGRKSPQQSASPQLAQKNASSRLSGHGWSPNMSPTLAGNLAASSQKHGVDLGYMKTLTWIESKGDANAVSPTGARGIGQFTRATGIDYGLIKGGQDLRGNEALNVDATARLAKDNARIIGSKEPHLLYMAHQQGAGGVAALLRAAKNGDSADGVMVGKQSLRDNMDVNGGKGMSPSQFLSMWQNKFAKVYNAVNDGSMPTNSVGNTGRDSTGSIFDNQNAIADEIDNARAYAEQQRADAQDALDEQMQAMADAQAEAEHATRKITREARAGLDSEVEVSGKYEPTQWQLMEADDLDPTMKKADNQLRDRTRMASELQIDGIANNLDFRKLGESPMMDYGAPTLGMDGKIIGGNGRVAGITRAYSSGKADGYKTKLAENAGRFGFTPDDVAGMQKPVLVRRFKNFVDTTKAAIASNEGGGLVMTALEQAKADGIRLPDLKRMQANEDGNINTAANRDFIRAFIAQLPINQQSAFADGNGQLSKQGVERLRNAVLYKAYGDTPQLQRMIESTDDGSRNIANALTQAAPRIADAKNDIAKGDVHDADISQDMVDAVGVLEKIRSEGGSLREYLAQRNMFGEDLSVEARQLLKFFNENIKSAKNIRTFIGAYYDALEAQGSPKQDDIFGDAVTVDKPTLLNKVINEQSRQSNDSDLGGDRARGQSDRGGRGEPAQIDRSAGEAVEKTEQRSTAQGGTDGGTQSSERDRLSQDVTHDFAGERPSEAAQAAHDEKLRLELEQADKQDNAPSADSFTLSGSDRDADVAAAHGQESMFSRSAETKDNYEKRIDELFSDKKAGRVGVTVLNKSDVLDLLGYGGKPIVLQESKVIQGMDKHPEMTADVWKNIPDWIENPVAVFQSDTVSDRLVFVAPEMVAGVPVIVIVEPDAQISGSLNAHLMINAYGTTGSNKPYFRWIRDGLLKYANKQKFLAFAHRVGFQLSEKDMQNKQGSAKILTDKQLDGYRKTQPTQSISKNTTPTGNTVTVIQASISKMLGVDASKSLPNVSILQTATPEIVSKLENGQLSVIAWHGTPHTVDKFSNDKIGTGEGAQAYGYGLYFASKRDVAETYKKNIPANALVRFTSENSDAMVGDFRKTGVFDAIPNEQFNLLKSLKEEDWIGFDNPAQAVKAILTSDLDNFDVSDTTKSAVNKIGNLYEVELSPKESEMIFWDKPLGEQGEYITSALKSILKYKFNPNESVAGFYNGLSGSFGASIGLNGTEKEASEYLYSNGIKGIKFLDGSSRKAGEGSYNYVIFSDDDVAIKAQYSKQQNDSIQGAYDGKTGRIYLFADNIKQGEERAVLLHELFHKRGREVLGDNYSRLKSLVDGWENSKAGTVEKRIFDVAKSRADKSGETGSRYDDELIAYAIEETVNTGIEPKAADIGKTDARGFLARVMQLFSNAMKKLVPGYKGKFNAQDLVHVAYGLAGMEVQNTEPQRDSSGVRFSKTNNEFTVEPETKLQHFERQQVNSMNRLTNVEKQLKDNGITLSVDASSQSVAYHGRLTERLHDFREKNINQLLKKMVAVKTSADRVDWYLLARHAIERNAQIAKINDQMPDGGSGMMNQQARDLLTGKDVSMSVQIADKHGKVTKQNVIVTGFNARELAQMRDIGTMVDAITADNRKLTVGYGLESAQDVAGWTGMYKHYVPLAGIVGANEFMGVAGAQSGFSVRGGKKRAMGRSSVAPNILEQVLRQREDVLMRGEKNLVARAFVVNTKEAMSGADMPMTASGQPLYELNPADMKPYMKNGKVEWRSVPDTIGRNVVTARHKGKDIVVRVNDAALAEAVRNLDAPQLGGLLKWWKKGTSTLSMMYTGASPLFWGKAFIRDIWTVATVGQRFGLTGSTLRNLPKALQVSFASEFNNRRGGSNENANFKEFRLAGGRTGFIESHRDLTERRQAIEKQLLQMGDLTLQSSPVKIKEALKGALEWMTYVGSSFESAVRFAAYQAAKDKGLDNLSASNIAKEITINFNRKGASKEAQVLNTLFVFYNASVQGLSVQGKALKDKRVLLSLVPVAALGVLGQAMSLASVDDDDERELLLNNPTFQRDRVQNILIPTGDDKRPYLKIPLPPDLYWIAGVSASIADGIYHDRNSVARGFEALGMGFGKSFLPPPIGDIVAANPLKNGGKTVALAAPSLVKPLAQSALNVSFTGTPLMPENTWDDTMPDSQKMWRRTENSWASSIAIGMSNMTGGDKHSGGIIDISPESIKNTVQAYTGGIGAFLFNGYDAIDNPKKGMLDAPIVADFFASPDAIERGNSSRVSQIMAESKDMKAQVKAYVKEGNNKRAAEVTKQLNELTGGDMSIDYIRGAYSKRDNVIRKTDPKSPAIDSLAERRAAADKQYLKDRDNRLDKLFNK